jgi:hypothetical protein
MGMQRNRSARQADAQERNAARATITDQQQLDRLNNLFGEGLGAKKERARLAVRIAGAVKVSAPKKAKSSKGKASKEKE